MDIVKVGGSLCRSGDSAALLDWLEARARTDPLLVVCGGGAYADLVRSEQRRLDFDELTAHRQALLAMEQQAWWLHGAWLRRHQRYCPVDGSAQVGTLWTPRELIDDPGDVEPSWAITSDSLAGWLALRQPVDTLWLLKSVDITEADDTPADWVARGWVDPCFPSYARRLRCRIRLLGQRGWSGAPGRAPESPAA